MSAWYCWVRVNELIGWVLDMDKTPEPARDVRLLGALLRLDPPRPHATLPEDRVQALVRDLDDVLATRKLSSSSAASLRGRLGWARSFLFGRYGAAALAPLRARQYDPRGQVKLTTSLEAALCWFRATLEDRPVREMLVHIESQKLVVTISDGEGTGSVAVGIWMPREKRFRPEITRADVPETWLQEWSRGGSRSTAIMEIEGVGPLLALSTWPSLLENGLWVHFLDNESAMFSLIRGSSRADSLNRIVHLTWDLCRQRRLYPWWDRVATKDNPVDQASRRNMADLYDQRWLRVPPRLPDLWATDLPRE